MERLFHEDNITTESRIWISSGSCPLQNQRPWNIIGFFLLNRFPSRIKKNENPSWRVITESGTFGRASQNGGFFGTCWPMVFDGFWFCSKIEVQAFLYKIEGFWGSAPRFCRGNWDPDYIYIYIYFKIGRNWQDILNDNLQISHFKTRVWPDMSIMNT